MKAHPFYFPMNRRKLLRALMIAFPGLAAPGAFAEALTLTPHQTEGPYFPDKLPLDQDNDLVRLSDRTSNALGTVTNISGRILDRDGKPLKNALVELWQADNQGAYIHTNGAPRNGQRDPDFQGYGRFETASDGGYRFRTIKPGLYTGRTRHYHFGVTLPGQRRFSTQLYFAGEAGNDKDMVLRGIRDEKQRASVIREFRPLEGSPEQAATWDIVMGETPGDDDRRPPRLPRS